MRREAVKPLMCGIPLAAAKSLMTQMELVVDAHLRGPALDTSELEALKPEMLKVEAIRGNGRDNSGLFEC
jgi:hypothetical protein